MALSGNELTRIAVGGSGKAYQPITAKTAAEVLANFYRGFIVNVNRMGLR